jgi:hypothetical protein
MTEMWNIIFIKGTKQSIVDFFNRGLKGCKSTVRVSADMSGGQIADRLIEPGCPISMNSYLPMPQTYLNYDTSDEPWGFCDWYEVGCCNNAGDYDLELMNVRKQEIYDYLQAHPERFTADETGSYELADFDRALKTIHPELIEPYRKYRRGYYQAAAYQQRKYGVVGWEEWRIKHYGCPYNEPLDVWKVEYETKECLCLSSQIYTTMRPIAFMRYINGLDGITVYAYGFNSPGYQPWYQYNGQTDELTEKDVLTDPRFEQYKEALKQQADYNPKTVDAEASYKVLEGYLQDFRKEVNEEMLFPLQNVR